MESTDAQYRLKLASGFLNEAKGQFKQGFFRAVVDSAQLCVILSDLLHDGGKILHGSKKIY